MFPSTAVGPMWYKIVSFLLEYLLNWISFFIRRERAFFNGIWHHLTNSLVGLRNTYFTLEIYEHRKIIRTAESDTISCSGIWTKGSILFSSASIRWRVRVERLYRDYPSRFHPFFSFTLYIIFYVGPLCFLLPCFSFFGLSFFLFLFVQCNGSLK